MNNFRHSINWLILTAFIFTSQNLSAQDSSLYAHNFLLSHYNFSSDIRSNSYQIPQLYLETSAIEKERSLKKKRWGIALTSLGIGLTTTGIIMMANADELFFTISTSGESAGDPLGGFGVLTFSLGVGGLISGPILWRKGNLGLRYHKKREKL